MVKGSKLSFGFGNLFKITHSLHDSKIILAKIIMLLSKFYKNYFGLRILIHKSMNVIIKNINIGV